MRPTDSITFIQTGGTIDKEYPAGATHHGYGFEITTPAFLRILARAGAKFAHEDIEVLKKDSLDLTDADRDEIARRVEATANERIIITHGTDTVHLTARRLSTIEGKIIVFTGAMLPERFYNSDAAFNLGLAVGAVQSLPTGVYVALYGEVLPWQEFHPS